MGIESSNAITSDDAGMDDVVIVKLVLLQTNQIGVRAWYIVFLRPKIKIIRVDIEGGKNECELFQVNNSN